MSSIYSLGDSGDWDYYDEASHNFSAAVDKFIGRHSIKSRASIIVSWRPRARASTAPPVAIPSTPTASLGASNTGVDLADLLLGLPYNRQADTASTLTDYIPYYGAFIQDNFRLSSKITINAGIRWEHEGGVSEKNNGLITGFNENVASPIASQVPGLESERRGRIRRPERRAHFRRELQLQ